MANTYTSNHRASDGTGAIAPSRRRGRGAQTNASGRFEPLSRGDIDDGWRSPEDLPGFATHVTREAAKRIITQNTSPDIGFDQSINPYRGCEHGCAYCYSRPTHAYMGLSPGLDFESRLFAKTNAIERLEGELADPAYTPKTIALGTNTDPYQPIERTYRITRGLLELCAKTRHPVGIVTKSALVLRDLDILKELANHNLVKVAFSVTTLDRKLARSMEPRASTPAKRLDAMCTLSDAGVRTAVMVAPIIPAVNDHEIETILKRAAAAGASEAGYVMLRLPLEVRDVFDQWLEAHMPDRAERVRTLVRGMRGGKANDPRFGTRMTGSGPYAWAIGRRFELAAKRLGLNRQRLDLDISLFEPPARAGQQLRLL